MPPNAKGVTQLQAEAQVARKKAVDAKNTADAAQATSDFDELADTPLTEEESAFCLDILPRMNEGRKIDMPCSADILRFSKLRGRMGIKAKGPE